MQILCLHIKLTFWEGHRGQAPKFEFKKFFEVFWTLNLTESILILFLKNSGYDPRYQIWLGIPSDTSSLSFYVDLDKG